ncbi:antitoxin [Bifidobacterium aemilianum]|uniref:Antitoxin n=1 Tax=Bifidobacterium aemilianum TaxID=2493120 RepID=A0A366KB52_9BIFI|nr:antitoxin [Bifidobacterium aemilianum]RBP98472.1 antitoxin [Bifidobacterium aemilianum]
MSKTLQERIRRWHSAGYTVEEIAPLVSASEDEIRAVISKEES